MQKLSSYMNLVNTQNMEDACGIFFVIHISSDHLLSDHYALDPLLNSHVHSHCIHTTVFHTDHIHTSSVHNSHNAPHISPTSTYTDSQLTISTQTKCTPQTDMLHAVIHRLPLPLHESSQSHRALLTGAHN
ncbi:hypothetical protein Bca52824_054162 [Brassica carinata]|uniref:Uncharacterized protein n=1 Tax=Brassica carinata TaxID=52824 RepID=A0A8X7R826_BRACI|nr:hypothetical protein Bca52824_054162 [Brassica carinata]